MRKYPEQVEAEMYRVVKEGKVILLRQSAKFDLGSPVHKATVIMTNPGSFKLKSAEGWDDFEAGLGGKYRFSGKDYPDMTRQNVIEVLRAGYAQTGGKPSCRVEVINISNVVNPEGREAVAFHNTVRGILGDQSPILQLDIIRNHNAFKKKCNQSDIIIMGFVKGAFQ